jgi:D-alanyl-D-alanine carboxypeptidase/D-alanyl-D-alanine-endopeptidase (penicillin-binding protein 4)
LLALAPAICALSWSPAVRAEEKLPAEVQQLRSAIGQIISNSAIQGARAGVLVSSIETGQVLYAHNPDELLNPASNVKLFTTAAALARLGPEYRFDTEFYVGPGETRSLYVKGKGDPWMLAERLWAVAGELQHLGIRTVRGDLVLDDGYFDAEAAGPGFDQEHGDKSYLAPPGALALDFDSVAIHVSPGGRVGERGRVEVEPESEYFKVENRTVTVGARSRRRVTPSSIPLEGKQRIVVDGRLPLGGRAQVFYRKIDNPTFYFGYTLKRLLEARGIQVQGRVRRGAVPAGARLLYVHQSEALAEIVRRLNKHSNNFMAEQLVKALGAEAKGPPGTWPKGIEAIEDFLAEVGLPRGAYVMKNGSGLNDANRFSARQTVTLLREMWKRFPLMPEYLTALPVAGRDGTIRWRMEGTDAAGRLRAKTGTLEGVTSLSGYVETRGHQHLAFAVFVNDYPGRHSAIVRAVDAIGSAMAATGGAPDEMGAAVASARPPEGAAAIPVVLADLKGRIGTYYKFGSAADRRNVPFLRTALRAERDPVVRMAAAEAIYLSDPDSDTAQHTFLDNLAIDAQSLARLSAVATDLPVANPVLGSLSDLAAQGGAEAISRLLELAPAASDPKLSESYAGELTEVARNAPRELLDGLRGASPASSDAALRALTRGLSRAHDVSHPFLALLEKVAGGEDAGLAAHAKRVEALLANRTQVTGGDMSLGPVAPSALPVPIPVVMPSPAPLWDPAAASGGGKGGG